MVHILTGARDCGKTLAMERLFIDKGRGDGIISPKRFVGGRFTGYNVRRLSTGAEMPLAEIDPSVRGEWDEVYRLGNFSFSREGVTFANSALDEMRRNGVSPLYVDEVGLLELSGRGFALDESVFRGGADVYVSVRDRYLEKVIHKYRIHDYTIMRVDRGAGNS
jgi:nucleoside-triphosphatase THEP1